LPEFGSCIGSWGEQRAGDSATSSAAWSSPSAGVEPRALLTKDVDPIPRERGIGGQPVLGDGALVRAGHLDELPGLDAAEFAGTGSGAVDPPNVCRRRDADVPPQECLWRGVSVGNNHGTDGATEFGEDRSDALGRNSSPPHGSRSAPRFARPTAGPLSRLRGHSKASAFVELVPRRPPAPMSSGGRASPCG